jgi:hypothetical protein
VLDAAALRHLLPPDLGKNLLQRDQTKTGGGEAVTPNGDSFTPPPARPAKAGEMNVALSRVHLLHRETPARAQADAHPPAPALHSPAPNRQSTPALAPSAAPIRRAILLSRPTPRTT